MIRFKKAAAADVPTPPPGYVSLFVDDATGQPSAKDDAGTVASLKGADGEPGTDGEDGADGAPGTGLPEGGTVGQVVTKTEGGAAWQDPPAGEGGGEVGIWESLLPAAGGVLQETERGSPMAATTAAEVMVEDAGVMGIGILAVRPDLLSHAMDRVRVTMTVIIDATIGELDGGGAGTPPVFSLNDYGTLNVELPIGTSVVEFELPYADNSASDGLGYYVGLGIEDEDNVLLDGWGSITLDQLDVRVHERQIEAASEPLTMTPLAVIGSIPDGGGGLRIERLAERGSLDLSAVTDIDVIGVYPAPVSDNSMLETITEICGPRYLDESAFIEFSSPCALEYLGDPNFFWRWPATMPAEIDGDYRWWVAKVSVDSGAPVLALLSNVEGF